MGTFWVYVLENAKGRFYIGQTSDVSRRVSQHNAPLEEGVSHPRKHGPWRLVWSERHDSRVSAMHREKQIKPMKSARWIREHLLAQGGR